MPMENYKSITTELSLIRKELRRIANALEKKDGCSVEELSRQIEEMIQAKISQSHPGIIREADGDTHGA